RGYVARGVRHLLSGGRRHRGDLPRDADGDLVASGGGLHLAERVPELRRADGLGLGAARRPRRGQALAAILRQARRKLHHGRGAEARMGVTRRLLMIAAALLAWLAFPAPARANQAAIGWCQLGGQVIVTSGLQSLS